MQVISRVEACRSLSPFAIKVGTILARLGGEAGPVAIEDVTLMVSASNRVPGALRDLERAGFVTFVGEEYVRLEVAR
jgi:hypothetical protein